MPTLASAISFGHNVNDILASISVRHALANFVIFFVRFRIFRFWKKKKRKQIKERPKQNRRASEIKREKLQRSCDVYRLSPYYSVYLIENILLLSFAVDSVLWRRQQPQQQQNKLKNPHSIWLVFFFLCFSFRFAFHWFRNGKCRQISSGKKVKLWIVVCTRFAVCLLHSIPIFNVVLLLSAHFLFAFPSTCAHTQNRRRHAEQEHCELTKEDDRKAMYFSLKGNFILNAMRWWRARATNRSHWNCVSLRRFCLASLFAFVYSNRLSVAHLFSDLRSSFFFVCSSFSFCLLSFSLVLFAGFALSATWRSV